jgi:hypothetical protein
MVQKWATIKAMIVRETTEDASSTAIRECRLLFLRAAAEHPQIRIWDSLREKVHEPSRRLWTELGLPVPPRPYRELTPEQHLAMEPFSRGRTSLIENWMTGHNLRYEWVYSSALDELTNWSFPVRPFNIFPGYPSPEFTWRAWFFGYDTEQAYRKLVKDDFRKALDEYVRAVKLQRRHFLKNRGSQSAHYRWAVEHICLGWGWSHISRKDRSAVTWQAVRKAVLPILEQIGIPRHNPPKPEMAVS